MPLRWFIDTGFVIALVSPRDAYHDIALDFSTRIQSESIKLITSDAVLLEIGAALSRLAYRAAAIDILQSMRHDPHIEVIALNTRLMDNAVGLFSARADKEWSLTDCVSFELMRTHEIHEALSADGHVEQAGFAALMRAH